MSAGGVRGFIRAALAFLALVTLLVATLAARPAQAAAASAEAAPGPAQHQVTLTLFWGEGCRTCEAERQFLSEQRHDHPGLRVEQFEVWRHDDNRARLEQAARRYGLGSAAVPMTIVDGRVWVGFTGPIRDDMAKTIEAALRGEPVTKGVYGRAGEGTCTTGDFCPAPGSSGAAVDVPLVGRVNLGGQSLLVATLVIGFVDGINPCSLWAISILLAIVIRTGSRRRVLATGSTFLLITAGMYAAYMAGMYSALSVVGYLNAIRIVIGVTAAVFGVLAVKDYFFFKRGVSLTIPEGSKPGLYQRMRGVAASKSLLAALGATGALAVAVSLLETPCTAGFPLLWTSMLASHKVGLLASALLFVVYMIPFLLDEMIVFVAAVTTMRAAKLQEKHGRLLKLVAGTVMLALAVTMIFLPGVMEDLLGASAVFAVAIAVAAAVHGVTSGLARHAARPVMPK